MSYLLLAGQSSGFESGAFSSKRYIPPPPSYHQLASNLVPSSKAGGLILPPEYNLLKKHSPRKQMTMLPLPADRSVAKTRKGSFGFGKKAVELWVPDSRIS